MPKDFNVICAIGCSFFHSAVEGEEKGRTNYAPEHEKHYKKGLLGSDALESTQYRDNTFEKLVASKCGAESVNLSVRGASNSSIFRKAMHWLESSSDTHGHYDRVLVIGLTELLRESRYNVESKVWQDIHISDMMWSEQCDYLSDHKEGGLEWYRKDKFPYIEKEWWDKYWKTQVKYFSEIDILEQDLLHQIELLSCYCEQNKVQLLFVNNLVDWVSFEVYSKYRSSNDLGQMAERFKGEIRHRNLLMFPNGSCSLRRFLTSTDTGYKGEHPNSGDHLELAKVVYEHTTKKTW